MPTSFSVYEKTSAKLTAILKDETGAAVSSALLTTFTLTLYDKATGAIINSRDDQNVLNANNVTVDTSGNVVWTLQPADNIILDDSLNREHHRALFEWSWATGTKTGKDYVDISVLNLAKVS